ncbi:hypothetical protein SY88_12460 [Clostridiales bacterium PH28_bin88]|nr:hypothetical protein SY88_12460 [Clostridiales bacterium PH28_bin88]
MKVRVALAQTNTLHGTREYDNTLRALELMEEAQRAGAKLLCFPEGYPGPYSGPMDSGGRLPKHPMEMLADKARKLGIYVVAGCVEPYGDEPDTYRLSEKLISPSGEIIGNYYRMQPNHPLFNSVLMDGKMHIVPGEEFVLVPTPIGNIGLLICSELFVPELSRVLMLRGADIIVAGSGGNPSKSRTRLTDTWRAMAWARAAENHVYVLVTQNMYQEGKRGRACIAGPEGLLAHRDDAGLVVADLDMDRLAFLRSHFYDEEVLRAPASPEEAYGARPGQTHDRRPEMYQDLVRPQLDAFDYHYMFRQGDWREDFKKEYTKIQDIPHPRLA